MLPLSDSVECVVSNVNNPSDDNVDNDEGVVDLRFLERVTDGENAGTENVSGSTGVRPSETEMSEAAVYRPNVLEIQHDLASGDSRESRDSGGGVSSELSELSKVEDLCENAGSVGASELVEAQHVVDPINSGE